MSTEAVGLITGNPWVKKGNPHPPHGKPAPAPRKTRTRPTENPHPYSGSRVSRSHGPPRHVVVVVVVVVVCDRGCGRVWLWLWRGWTSCQCVDGLVGCVDGLVGCVEGLLSGGASDRVSGMLSAGDEEWEIFKQRHTWDLLASLFQSERQDRALRNEILEARAARPRFVFLLCLCEVNTADSHELWGEVVVTLWRASMTSGTTGKAWDELIQRILVWGILVDSKDHTAEWA
ncbi:hypothetical protein V8E52_004399 [Russula decolorans]